MGHALGPKKQCSDFALLLTQTRSQMLVHNFKRRLLFLLVSTTTLVLFSAIQLVDGEQCNDVLECVDSLPNIEGLSYRLNTLTWNDNDNNVCPRSDPSVLHWQITVENGNNDNPLTNLTYCSRGVAYVPSVVCCRNGTLIFVDLSGIHSTSGEVTFEFTASGYDTIINIKYAKTGVFPDEATVHFNEGDATVQLSYFIYSPQSNLPMTVHHNGVLVTDDISTFPDVTSCVQSTISEQAIIFIVTIVNPTFDSAGVYELVVGDSLSAVATLVANYTPPSPSASLVSPTVSSPTPTITSTTTTPVISPSVTPPTSPTNDNNDRVGIISGSVVGSLVFLIAIVVVIVVIILAYYRCCQHRDEQEDADVALPLQVLHNGVINEMVNENIYQSNADSMNTTDDSKGNEPSNKQDACNDLDSNTLANGKTPVVSDTPLSSDHTSPDTPLSPDHTSTDTPLSSDRTSAVTEEVPEQDKILKIVQENQATLNKILILMEQDKGTVLKFILKELREGKELSKDSIELLREVMGKLEDKQVIDVDEQGLEDPTYQSHDLQSVSTETSAHQSHDSSSSAHQSNDSKSSAHKSQELNSNVTIHDTSSTDSNQLPHDKSDQMEGEANDDNHSSSTGNDSVSINDDVMDSSGSNS